MNGSNENEIREMRENERYLQNADVIMPGPHVALCDSHNEYDILKHAQEQSIRTYIHIFQSSPSY